MATNVWLAVMMQDGFPCMLKSLIAFRVPLAEAAPMQRLKCSLWRQGALVQYSLMRFLRNPGADISDGRCRAIILFHPRILVSEIDLL